MAISAADRTFIFNNQGHVLKLMELFFENARNPGNTTLGLAFAIGQDGLGGMTTPNGCTATNIINSLKDFVDEIQS